MASWITLIRACSLPRRCSMKFTCNVPVACPTAGPETRCGARRFRALLTRFRGGFGRHLGFHDEIGNFVIARSGSSALFSVSTSLSST